jgi:hypothetical protein
MNYLTDIFVETTVLGHHDKRIFLNSSLTASNLFFLDKVKHFLFLLPLILTSIPAQAQQVNQFGVCTQYQEVYVPGGYDQYGNYYQGGVQTQSYNVPCNQVSGGNWNPSNQYNNGYYGRATNPNCNPVRTLLGATLGGAIGRSMTSTSNNRNNSGWATALGASLGGLVFAC